MYTDLEQLVDWFGRMIVIRQRKLFIYVEQKSYSFLLNSVALFVSELTNKCEILRRNNKKLDIYLEIRGKRLRVLFDIKDSGVDYNFCIC